LLASNNGKMAAVIRGHGTTKIVSTVNSLGKEDFVLVAICHERCAGTTSHRTGEDGRSAPLVAWDNASEPGRWQVDRFFFSAAQLRNMVQSVQFSENVLEDKCMDASMSAWPVRI
jgi:hypothetical protein